MEVINTILATIGKLAALMVLLGAFLTGTVPAAAPLPAQPVATDSTTSTSSGQASSPQATTAEFPVAPAATSTSGAKPAQKNGLVEANRAPGPFFEPVSPSPAPTTPTKSQEQINNETRAALVNILCTPQVGINGVSGSGVIIDSRGVILTNAHIGQYLLLRDYLTKNNISCTVRIGSPAQERYTATLLYLPPAWITANASQLKAAQATGTGENDYAFLLITGRTDPAAALPGSFDTIAMDRGYVDVGDPMLLAAYPAGFLGGETVQKNLYISSAVAYVTQLFTYGDRNKVDLFSIGGTVVSQGGSSGGAAVRLRDGKLAGIIATETVAATTQGRDLRAISLAHIDDSLTAAGKGGIVPLLLGDLITKAADFNANVAPSLTTQLETALKGN